MHRWLRGSSRKLIIGMLVLVAILEGPVTPASSKDNTISTKVLITHDFRGGNLTGYWHDSFEQPDAFDQLDYMKSLGMNAVAIVTTWYQDEMASIEVTPRYDAGTPTKESLRNIGEYARSLGLIVMLKPHVDPLWGWDPNDRENGRWRGVIEPTDPNLWFDSYEAFVVEQAELAEEAGIQLLSIGTEYPSMTATSSYRARWGQIVDSVRAVYSGDLVYTAHEYEVFGGHYELKDEGGNTVYGPRDFTALPTTFWSMFDYAGTTVYYDLSRDTMPETLSLMASWQESGLRPEHLRRLVQNFETWQAGHGKPVIFSEIGYRSIDCTAWHPFVAGGPNDIDCSANYNGLGQYNAYEAALQVWNNRAWLKGMFWWQFEARFVGDRECSESIVGHVSYTPCGKPAADALYTWYGESSTVPVLPPSYLPSLPIIDEFEYSGATSPHLERVWQPEATGAITYTMDSSVKISGNQSLHIVSQVTCTPESDYVQLTYWFGQPQSWSMYDSIQIWVRGDLQNAPPCGGHLGLALVDAGPTGDQEYEIWQSSRWLTRAEDWHQISVRLSGSEVGDPWNHPNDLVIPDWTTGRNNNKLDLSSIAGVRIIAHTTDEGCQDDPRFEIWVDELRLRSAIYLPIIIRS
jgi:hypothetical protein